MQHHKRYTIRFIDYTDSQPVHRCWFTPAASEAEAVHLFTQQFPGPAWDRVIKTVDKANVSV